MELVTTMCNQCEQNDHNRCPAEALVRQGFISNSGDHCYCAAEKHTRTTQTTKESPVIKSMLGKQKEERDIATNTGVTEEVEND